MMRRGGDDRVDEPKTAGSKTGMQDNEGSGNEMCKEPV